MELRALEQAMEDFVTSKGWYRPDSPRPQTPRNLAISLVLEAAGGPRALPVGETADREALADELADVMLYLLQLARLHGIDLGEAVMAKLARNAQREWP
jgi:8-oxo-dGTP diphosphatase